MVFSPEIAKRMEKATKHDWPKSGSIEGLTEDIISTHDLIRAFANYFHDMINASIQDKGEKCTEKTAVFYFSLDMRWMTPRQAQKLLDIAIERGIVSIDDNGLVVCMFDFLEVYEQGFMLQFNADNTITGKVI